MKFLLLALLFIFSGAWAHTYPKEWWAPVPESERFGSWEILPQEVGSGAVILSKRTELGVFSNFGHTPFILDGTRYASIEGFWQMMKYPEKGNEKDPRLQYVKEYPFSRAQVMKMHGFEAKKAGDLANKVNKKHGFKKVSYHGKFFNYKDHDQGSQYHYKIIFKATQAKIDQNPKVKKLLLKTRGLILKPDHHQEKNVPPSYHYFDILMELRSKIK